jgi:hypothetical protein
LNGRSPFQGATFCRLFSPERLADAQLPVTPPVREKLIAGDSATLSGASRSSSPAIPTIENRA